MSLLKKLKSDDSIADEKDSVGGFSVLDSNTYAGKITLAYLTTASSGALGLALHMDLKGAQEYRETLWMTSGTAKGGNNYYERDGEKHYLQGYLIANSIALLTVGKEIGDLDTETKVVALYNKEAGSEVPTKVEVLEDLIGQELVVGILKEITNKSVKADDGSYIPTDETREQNVIDKVFRAKDMMTTAEIRAAADKASFHETWIKKWEGVERNRVKAGAKTSRAASTGSTGTPKPTKSLFA